MKKLVRLFAACFGGAVALVSALVLPIMLKTAATVLPVAGRVSDWLVQATYAQTAPATIGEMTTEVKAFADLIMPGWLVYTLFALIAAVGIWLIFRAIRSAKGG